MLLFSVCAVFVLLWDRILEGETSDTRTRMWQGVENRNRERDATWALPTCPFAVPG